MNSLQAQDLSIADIAAALQDGALHTGGIGYLDADGLAYIVDRKKDIIIRGGQNIYPADIEEVLYGVDGVAEAAVKRRKQTETSVCIQSPHPCLD